MKTIGAFLLLYVVGTAMVYGVLWAADAQYCLTHHCEGEE